MLSKALDYIKLNNMIEKGDRIVAGISGGADSVCLLHVLKDICGDYQAKLTAVHVNHGIRGNEADRDEQFVRELCGSLGIDFLSYTYDVKRLAREEGLSEEEAGRKVRYEAFAKACKLKQCNKIAIAHNKNDNAETVLFHLFRGSGLKGLSGIEAKRTLETDFGEAVIIRPLLCAERSEIEACLYRNNIPFMTDSTNLTEDYSRNKIRGRILKYAAAEINAGAVENINEAASQIREALLYIEDNIKKGYQRLVRQEDAFSYRISADSLLQEPAVIRKGILKRMLESLAKSSRNLEAKHVGAVLSLTEKQVGRQVHLPCKMVAVREYEDILLYIDRTEAGEAEDKKDKPVRLKIPGRIFVPRLMKYLEAELLEYKKNEPIPKSSCEKWFDYDKIENAVEIRTRKEGDYIQINSFGGNKKIKDYFIDHKIPRKSRDSKPLIADGSHIMWIPGEGERMSEKYKVDEATKRILLIKLIDLEGNTDGRQSKSHDIGGSGKPEDQGNGRTDQ